MMPELGKYAVAVLGSYGAAILLMGILTAVSLWQGRRVKRALAAYESGKEE